MYMNLTSDIRKLWWICCPPSWSLQLGLRMHMMPCIAHAGRPWSSRTTTVELNMKIEHNLYLACEDSPQRAFFFCTFSCSCLALLASTVSWLRCFLFLNAANCRLCSVLNSTKRVCSGGRTTLSYVPSIVKKCRSSLSSIATSVHVTCEFLCVQVSANWHSWLWQTRHTYVRMHVHCENRSLIPSLALMRSAIIYTHTSLRAPFAPIHTYRVTRSIHR